MVILDASHSLFQPDDPHPRGSLHYLDPRFSTSIQDTMSVLRPIPKFRTIVQDIVKETGSSRRGKVFSVDIGVICDTSSVGVVGGALYDRVAKELREPSKA